MGMPALRMPDFWTAEMVQAMPADGMRHETVYGELFVSPSPRLWHELVAERLQRHLSAYLTVEPVGLSFKPIADISWGSDVLVQPDIFVAPFEEVRTLDWSRVKSLLLVAEILSPSTARADRFAKRILYQRVGIPCYWVIDADRRHAEVWTPASITPTIERTRLTWRPEGAATACVIELAELFREV